MREYLVVFAVAASVTYLLSTVSRVVAERVGAVARVRDRDVHATPVPYFGGLAMLGGLVAAYLVARNLPFLSTAEEVAFNDADAVLQGRRDLPGRASRRPLRARRAGQVRRPGLAGVIVVVLGVQFFYLPLLRQRSSSLDQAQGPLIFTVLLIVGTANAVNFVDGLDGLAAGMVAIGAVAFFAYAYVLAVENEPDAGHRGRAADRPRSPARASASCRTTSSRPGCSSATPARC